MNIVIRKFEEKDIDDVMKLWLNGNIEAHSFIPSKYWTDNYDMVKALLPQAEIYVHENEYTKSVDGFIGLSGNYIEGLFVDSSVQSKGIGKSLLDNAKRKCPSLKLKAYLKNTRAISFYQREGFAIQSETIDENTNEIELTMLWEKQKASDLT